MSDPFSLIHDALFSIVRNSSAMRSAILNYKKNLISGNDKRLSQLDTVLPSDLPEIRMTTSSLSGQVMFSSATINLRRSFEFRVTTGDQRPNESLYPVEFALICALTEANFGQTLRALMWYDQRFVTDVELIGVEESMESEEDRGVKGYIALFSVDARLSLSRVSLMKFSNGEPML